VVKKPWIVIAGLAAMALVIGAYAAYRALTKTTLGLVMVGEHVPAGTLVGNLSSNDQDLVMSSLGTLADSRDKAGQAKARELLASEDDYIWFNAALYLGTIGDTEAVPYLIKGLKHPASRAYPEVVRILEVLTGEHWGMDQAKWIAWWEKGHPMSGFSFAYASLAKLAAEIRTGSTVRINRVIDPVTVSTMGLPIAVIGVRVKLGVPAANAQRVLETAVMGQMVEVVRDGMDTRPDGSVPALISWEPDPFNGPEVTARLRWGLPAVPFKAETSVQKYLLESGAYELDVGSVENKKLLKELEFYSAVTRPAEGAGVVGK
jgi:hypothetical protein